MKKLGLYTTIGLGTGLEFYDFTIFAIFAINIGKTFFPEQHDPLIYIIQAFGLFAVGYFSRPLGGIFLAHFGDKLGRKKPFLVSILIMSLTTILMAMVPDYKQIGILAPITFVIMRFIQGGALGGEIPGALTYITEHTSNHKNLISSFLFIYMTLGVMLAFFVKYILSLLIDPNICISDWRYAFLIGGTLGILIFIIRSQLKETPIMLDILNTKRIKKIPILEIIKSNRKNLILSCIIIIPNAAGASLCMFFMPNFLILTNKYNHFLISKLTFISFLFMPFAQIIYGSISDKYNPYLMMLLALITSCIVSIPFFYFVIDGVSQAWLIFLYGTLLISYAMISVSYPRIIYHLFPDNLRYSGIAASYNIIFAIFGGLTPLIMAYATKVTGWLYSVNILYIFILLPTIMLLIILSKKTKVAEN